MPYLGPSKALLTTNDYSDWYGPGTIITDNPDQKPANWIYPEMYDPGVIWYWLNEDDCDKARKPGIFCMVENHVNELPWIRLLLQIPYLVPHFHIWNMDVVVVAC